MVHGLFIAVASRHRAQASVAAVLRLTCPTACGVFLDQGLNLCLLCWQVDSLPLLAGKPHLPFFFFIFIWLYQISVTERRVFNCVARAQQLWCRFSCRLAYGTLLLVPRAGSKPMAPALEDRFLTTGPPGKSSVCFDLCFLVTLW